MGSGKASSAPTKASSVNTYVFDNMYNKAIEKHNNYNYII